MVITVALAGDTMLGRGVGQRIAVSGPHGLFSGGVRDAFAEADLALWSAASPITDAPGRRRASASTPGRRRPRSTPSPNWASTA